MKLLKIKLVHFRRFIEEEIVLNLGINVFVGRNNSGKSTILEAIGLMFNYPSGLGQVQLNKKFNTGTCNVEITLKFDKEEWYKSLSMIQNEYIGKEEFRNAISEENIAILENIPIKGTWEASYSEGRRTNTRKQFSIARPEDLDSLEINIKPIINRAMARLGPQAFIQLFRSTTFLTAGRRTQTTPETMIWFNQLTGRYQREKSVRNRLFYLKEKSEPQYQDLTQKLMSIFAFEDFDVNLNHDTGNIELLITQNNEQFDINEMGSGTQSFLLLFSHIYLSGMDIAVIDEPETNMHPLLVQKLANFFRTLSKETQLILTTHDETFIKEFKHEEIFRVEYLDDEETSKVKKLDTPTDIDQLLELLGVKPSTLERAESRFTKILVFTEGRSDRKYIEKFAEKVGRLEELNAVKPTYWPLEGKWNLYKYVNPEFINTLSGTETPILLILDRDEDYEEEIRELEEKIGEKRLHYLKKREIESYLLDPIAILSCIRKKSEIKDEETKNKIADLTQDIIMEKLLTFADELKQKIILLRFLKRLLPLRFFYPIEMSDFVNDHVDVEIPEIIRDLSAMLYSKITNIPPEDLEKYMQEDVEYYDEKWTNETKLNISPAKDIITKLNKWLTEEFKVNISREEIIDELNTVDEDIVEIIDKICNPESLI